VLVVESLPMTTLMPQSKKAEIAKMSVRQYYNCLHDARFPEAARTVAGRLMGQSATKIMRAFLRDAELGSATNQVHILQTLSLLADPNKKRIELDDLSKPRFSPELSKEVAAVLNEAVESGETDDDPAPADPDDEQ
jgi:hypothetical protein